MKFFRYWARGSVVVADSERKRNLVRFDGSNESPAAAQLAADARARDAADRLQKGAPRREYDYGDQAIREEIVDEVLFRERRVGLVTRNSYGALVLNSSRALFADMDLPDVRRRPSWWAELMQRFVFGSMGPEVKDEPVAMKLVRKLTASRQGMGCRLYRTAAGFRCLVTSHEFEPGSPAANEVLTALQTDPLYLQLCKTQQCFRARLSPKFWRCGSQRPPGRFPFLDPHHEMQYRRWETAYHQRAAAFSTCSLEGSFGNHEILPSLAPLVALHDKLACRGTEKLA